MHYSLEEMTQGSWVNATYSSPPYIPMRGETHQNTCQGFDPKTTMYKTYEWMPISSSSSSSSNFVDVSTEAETKQQHSQSQSLTNPPCEFSRFDPLLYCPLVANKTIAIIGDSISFDHFLSLSHLLGVPQALPKVRRRGAIIISDTCAGNSTTIVNATKEVSDILHTDDGTSPTMSRLLAKEISFCIQPLK